MIPSRRFFLNFYLFICLLLSVLGLLRCARSPALRGLLIAAAALVLTPLAVALDHGL